MAMKFTFIFLNLGKIRIFMSKSIEGGRGGPLVKELFLKNRFFSASLRIYPPIPPNGRQDLFVHYDCFPLN